MKPKFVMALLLVALLVLGAAFFLNQLLIRHPANPPVPTGVAAASTTSEPATAVFPAAAQTDTASSPPMMAAPVATNALTPEQQQAAIDAETDRLQQWSMNDDPVSLSNILADLTNSEKEVREAAIEATKQFGSTNAIPTLKAVAANTTDPEEQIALLQAADFLSLPAISDSGVQLPRTPEQIQAATQKQAQRQSHNPK
jgi:hypothetical protein